MSEKWLRIALIVVDVFAALSAIVGAIGLVVGFMNIPLSVLSGTPFADFTIPALLLGIVVGGSALVAGLIALIGPRRAEPLASGIAGCIMVGWMTIEIAMIGMGSWLQPTYLVVGLVMIALAVALELRQRAALHQPALSGLHRMA
ncbi:MAG TPA: hypothetical protein VF812_15520 [Ktedonobacterales bacterium]